MPVLYHASFGYLKRHPWQLALALLGICIGVAVMVAVDLANESARRAFLASMDALNGNATHQVIAGPTGVDEAVYARMRVQHGIRSTAPIVAGVARYDDVRLQVLGVDPFAEREFRQFAFGNTSERGVVAAGSAANAVSRLLTVPGAVLVSTGTARTLGLDVNQTFTVLAAGREHTATLIGLFPDDVENRPDNLLLTDISNAQVWLGMTGKLSRIDVRIAPDDESLRQEIEATLPPGAQLLSAAGRTRTTLEMSDAFMTNLTAMSLLALLVGVFLIYNSVAFAVLQRRGLIGVLRALGLTRGEAFRLILAESALLGIIGATLGLLLGLLLGEQLLHLVSRTISDHYFVVQVSDVEIAPWSIVKGLVAGILATMVAAAIPALEASSYAPRLAMTRSAIETRTGRSLPLLATTGAGLIAVASVMLALSGAALVAGLIALFLLIIGVALLIPLCVSVVSKLAAPIAARLAGTVGRLAVSDVSASLSRTGVAIVALAVAVSATIGVSVMVESFRGSVNQWLENTLQSDIYTGVRNGSLDPGLLADLVSVDGVEHFSTSRRTWLETDAGRVRLVALQMAPGSYAGTSIRDANPADVWPGFDGEGAVLVSDAYAYRYEVGPGDTVMLKTARGDRAFQVAGIFQSYDANGGAILMSRRTYDIFFDDPGVDSIGVYLADGADPEQVMQSFRDISAGRQTLIMNSNAKIRELSLGIFDRTFVITGVLYWLAVCVAIIGILGAMLALQMERARQLAVLRALGMTPGQTGTLVILQTAYIGILSGLAAIPLGLVMAWVLVEVINRRAFGWRIDLDVAPGVLVTAVLLAAIAALLAGIYPARQAAQATPALAMREE